MVCELMTLTYIDPVIKLWRDHVPVRHRCYIGKRRLDSAIEQLHGEDGFDVNVKWYPWILSPKEIHRGRVVDKRTSYIKKLGSEAHFDAMVKQFKAMGSEDDVQIHFDYSKGVISSSLDAHRLILWSQSTARPKHTIALVEQLFSVYHEAGRSISDHSILLDCVDKAGLNVLIAERVLRSDDYRRQVGEQIMQLHQRHGVSGVPHVIITASAGEGAQRSFGFTGAQDTAFLLNVARKLAKGAQSDCINDADSKL